MRNSRRSTPGRYAVLVSRWSILTLVTASEIALASAATAVSFVEQERGVFVRAYLADSPAFDEDRQALEAPGFGLFQASLAGAASLTPSLADALAALDSNLGPNAVHGSGSASVGATVLQGDWHGRASADSFFEVVFDVAPGGEPYTLGGHVDASAQGGDGFASVELVDAASGLVIVEHAAAPGGSEAFDDSGPLPAGRYRLTAFALAHSEVEFAAGEPSGGASFEAVLTVPEPSARVQESVVLACLLIATALRGVRAAGDAN